MKPFGMLTLLGTRKNDGTARSGYGSKDKGKPPVLSTIFVVAGIMLGVFRAYALTPLSGVPDVLLLYILVLACFYDGSIGCLTALCAGFLCDALGSETVGLCTLFYTAAAFIPEILSRDNPKSRAQWYFIVLGVFAVFEMVVCGIGKLFGGIFTMQVLYCALRTVLYGAVCGSLIILFTTAGKKMR